MTKISIIKRAALTSASVASILMASGAAYAQETAQPATAQDSTSESDLPDMVVIGIRGSIERAQDLKRKAGAVIESITSEDLGKFSDQSIADSIQRVPGLQI